MIYLIDTNVISELTKPKPNKRVVEFMTDLEGGYISIITIHELTYGIELKPEGKAKNQLSQTVNSLISTFDEQIISIEREEALIAGRLRASAKVQGRTIHMADALIAATAHIRSLTVATRNTKDFKGLDIALLNPWGK